VAIPLGSYILGFQVANPSATGALSGFTARPPGSRLVQYGTFRRGRGVRELFLFSFVFVCFVFLFLLFLFLFSFCFLLFLFVFLFVFLFFFFLTAAVCLLVIEIIFSPGTMMVGDVEAHCQFQSSIVELSFRIETNIPD
jgi:hypothetical protein